MWEIVVFICKILLWDVCFDVMLLFFRCWRNDNMNILCVNMYCVYFYECVDIDILCGVKRKFWWIFLLGFGVCGSVLF